MFSEIFHCFSQSNTDFGDLSLHKNENEEVKALSIGIFYLNKKKLEFELQKSNTFLSFFMFNVPHSS